MSSVERLGAAHADALRRFFAALPDEDVTFIKEDVRSQEVVDSFTAAGDRSQRWVAVDDAEVVAYVALLPGVGWSDHVAELRLVVSPTARRRGLGRQLAQVALLAAFRTGEVSKVVVEVVAEQEAAAEMFRRLGFEGEALLRDHVRDRDGALRDVLLLAHFADDGSSALATIGAEGAPA